MSTTMFIVCGNLGQPSAYIELINAKDRADAVTKTTKVHGIGIRKVFTNVGCPIKLWSVVGTKYNKGEEFWITCKTYREALEKLSFHSLY